MMLHLLCQHVLELSTEKQGNCRHDLVTDMKHMNLAVNACLSYIHGLGGSLLGQADSFALKARCLLLPGVQDPSNQCLFIDYIH
jgi:hypothetical protein